ncbi:ribonuclease T2 [Violaceomyces palustris]|uniref:Ribonuclease T2 n=1 Tax=Violaceomyces palustris TaxID=1673888 RepID=A0ACD0NLF5_9BASI|nr:ribonuclease T2 [Violaceomyces palustris]
MLASIPLAALALAGSATASSLGFGVAKGVLECARAVTQLSCHSKYEISANSSATCCYNGALQEGSKESGLFLATQFWDAQPSTGPEDSTTIHGLWPDYCDGTYPQFCSNVSGIPEYTGAEIRSVLQKYDPELLAYMDVYYKDYQGNDESFWEHEYNKHGTCISTLRTECQPPLPGISREDYAVVGYFRQIVNRFRKLPTYRWLEEAGIVPSNTTTYTLAEIEGALSKKHGGVPYVGCTKKNQLDEFWYYFNTYGRIESGIFVPGPSTTKSSCPATGIRYL